MVLRPPFFKDRLYAPATKRTPVFSDQFIGGLHSNVSGVVIPHVADEFARRSMLPGPTDATHISVGGQVIQDDSGVTYLYNGDAEAVQIIGAGTEAANGYYTKRGTSGGKAFYNLIGKATDSVTDSIEWDSSGDGAWKIHTSGVGVSYTSPDNVARPDLATFVLNDGALPVPTTAHITSKNSLLTAAFVSGAGTAAANGIYTERPALGKVVGCSVYVLLGQPDDLNNYALKRDVTRWRLYDSVGVELYRSDPDSVANPWLSGGWEQIVGDLPVPTVASLTQGALDNGMRVTGAATSDANDIYPVSGNNKGRNIYTGIAHVLPLQWDSTNWTINATSPMSASDVAVPSSGSFDDGATITADPIASESNWEILP